MKAIWFLLAVPSAAAQTLVAVQPEPDHTGLLLVLLVAAVAGGLVWLKTKRPALFDKLMLKAKKEAPVLADDIQREALKIAERITSKFQGLGDDKPTPPESDGTERRPVPLKVLVTPTVTADRLIEESRANAAKSAATQQPQAVVHNGVVGFK